MRPTSLRSIAALAAGLALSVPMSASAACFEVIGCTDSQYFSQSQLHKLSCDSLWTVRNMIFHENGYCFQTAKGKAVFSNAGCVYMTSGAVPLNPFERANVERVRQVERQKGCG